jgi:hypothetical protein
MADFKFNVQQVRDGMGIKFPWFVLACLGPAGVIGTALRFGG